MPASTHVPLLTFLFLCLFLGNSRTFMTNRANMTKTAGLQQFWTFSTSATRACSYSHHLQPRCQQDMQEPQPLWVSQPLGQPKVPASILTVSLDELNAFSPVQHLADCDRILESLWGTALVGSQEATPTALPDREMFSLYR